MMPQGLLGALSQPVAPSEGNVMTSCDAKILGVFRGRCPVHRKAPMFAGAFCFATVL
jgi:hypothetical protein